MVKRSKKKIKKVMIMPVKKAKVATGTEQRVSALDSLVASSGWAIIIKILNDNISYLEKAILEKRDPQSKADLTDEAVGILRIKRNLNMELRDTPQKYKQVLIDIEKVPEVFDPYWSMEDIKKMESSLTKK